MASMCDHRANAGTVVIGKYLYVFGGFQTQSYGQVGVSSFERIDITDPKAHWEMQEFAPGSLGLGKIACFYLSDITDYLKANVADGDTSVERTPTGEVE